MNSVYVPVHVVLLLRRIVNVISTLSISNQYLLLKQAKADRDLEAANDRQRGDPGTVTTTCPTNRAKLPHLAGGVLPKSYSQRTFEDTKGTDWPWWAFRDNWNWPRLILVEPAHRYDPPPTPVNQGTLKADGGLFPWTGRTWSWPSLLSTSAYLDTHDSGSPGDPPPPPKPQNDHRPSQRLPPSREPHQSPPPPPLPLDTIHQLIQNPALYDPLRTPRYPIVLCHGLYGFDSRGPLTFPSMRMHYWSNVLNILRSTVGAEVIVTSVPGTGSISSRSEALDRQLQHKARGRGINFLAHSMGGLDCRHLITHVQPSEYAPLSLTTISTPHRGSPFMDWCAENLGIGKLRQQERDIAKARNSGSSTDTSSPTNPQSESPKPKSDTFPLSLSTLPSSFTTLLLSIVDSPAYANLTSSYLNDVFNPATPNDPTVKYFSVAGRMAGANVWHPFWLPKMVLDGVEEKERGRLRAEWEGSTSTKGEGSEEGNPFWAQEREWGNDGLVTIQSAKWGEFLGIMEGCDHWEMRGARGIEFGVDLPAIPAIGLGTSTAGHRSPNSNASPSQNSNGDGWGLPDWGRFVGAWKKEEKIQKDAAAATAVAKANTQSQQDDQSPEGRQHAREQQRKQDDAVIKSSTDKLSVVFDWLTDQVPSTPLLSTKAKAMADAGAGVIGRGAVSGGGQGGGVSEMQRHMDKEEKGRRKNELATKLDLERFYVALSRKLYDEGL